PGGHAGREAGHAAAEDDRLRCDHLPLLIRVGANEACACCAARRVQDASTSSFRLPERRLPLHRWCKQIRRGERENQGANTTTTSSVTAGRATFRTPPGAVAVTEPIGVAADPDGAQNCTVKVAVESSPSMTRWPSVTFPVVWLPSCRTYAMPR